MMSGTTNTGISKLLILFIFFLFTCVVIYSLLEEKNETYISVKIHSHPKQIIGERFLSLGLDTSNVFNGLDTLNLNSTKLIDLTSRLAPAYLRFGGTMADRLIFADDPPQSTNTLSNYLDFIKCQGDLCINKFLPYFTMSESDFVTIVDFCNKSNLRLIFDLNALLRNGEEWNPSNAIRLFEFVKSHDFDLDWQLGNEPNSFTHVFNMTVPPEQLGKDFKVLRKLVQKYFSKSLLVGPDTTRPQPNRPECVKYMKEFLAVASRDVDAMAWHQYYLNGRIATLDNFWNPDTMNLLQTQINTMIDNTRHYQTFLKMWLTETSSAYGGGAPHLSNSFAAIPLWLDKLGTAAKNGIQVVARQSLLGGNYSLIDENHNPLPDYWVSVLFKKLVGNEVLSCSIKSPPVLRFYCHCAAEISNSSNRNIVIYGMNLENKTSHVDFGGSAFNFVSQIDEYMLTAPDRDRMSKQILLNDVLLQYNNVFPVMSPRELKPGAGADMPPYSFVFWKIYNVDIPYCGT